MDNERNVQMNLCSDVDLCNLCSNINLWKYRDVWCWHEHGWMWYGNMWNVDMWECEMSTKWNVDRWEYENILCQFSMDLRMYVQKWTTHEFENIRCMMSTLRTCIAWCWLYKVFENTHWCQHRECALCMIRCWVHVSLRLCACHVWLDVGWDWVVKVRCMDWPSNSFSMWGGLSIQSFHWNIWVGWLEGTM